MAGGAVGGMVGGVASMDLNENWESTFQDSIRGGKAVVAVHAHDDAAAKKAEEILEGANPEKIEHLDSDGNQLSTSDAAER